MMSHEMIAMTCRFAHLAPAHLQAAADCLAEINRVYREGKTDGPTDTKTGASEIGLISEQPKQDKQLPVM